MRRIKLTEGDLHRIVKRVINEAFEDYNEDQWNDVYRLADGTIVQQRGNGKSKQFRRIPPKNATQKPNPFINYKDSQNQWNDAYETANGSIIQQRGSGLFKQTRPKPKR